MLTAKPDPEKIAKVWAARKNTDEEVDKASTYHLMPVTLPGKTALGIWFAGLLVFAFGLFLGSQGSEAASATAIIGMVIYFGGGLMRAYTD